MKTFYRILLAIALLMPLLAHATGYESLQVKAGRFYHYGEWPSALAMYQLMLDARPNEPSTYCHAIVAAELSDQRNEAVRLLGQSLEARVPLDSVFNGVRVLAFEQGDAVLYERFLEDTAERYPWMRRNIDARFLDYYTWRRDGQGMVEYATRMLSGLPDNVGYLTALADGYFTLGQDRHAVETYDKIIALDPSNYHALLVLGNYYYDMRQQNRFDDAALELARQYLSRADTLRPTPYVTTLLSTLI